MALLMEAFVLTSRRQGRPRQNFPSVRQFRENFPRAKAGANAALKNLTFERSPALSTPQNIYTLTICQLHQISTGDPPSARASTP
jgi:hypothetical protein